MVVFAPLKDWFSSISAAARKGRRQTAAMMARVMPFMGRSIYSAEYVAMAAISVGRIATTLTDDGLDSGDE